MTKAKRRHFWRNIWINLRDSWVLLKQFQWPLLAFVGTIIGGGALYQYLAADAGESPDGFIAAIYHVLGLVFLNPSEDFPQAWFLQIFYFLMPIIGLGALAHGMTDFGILFFNRKARGKEWAVAVAETLKDHVILIGLGHLGYRVAMNLHTMALDIAVIEIDPQADLVSNIRALDIPVIVDDGVREAVLLETGIQKARSIVLCTQNDSLNLQMAVKARNLNPDIEVVVRIFDDDFAHALTQQFGFHAISATASASPLFAAAATGLEMTRPIMVEGQALSLASLFVEPPSAFVGLSVEEIERDYDVSVVLIRCNDKKPDFHPAPQRTIQASDTLAILGEAIAIGAAAKANGGSR